MAKVSVLILVYNHEKYIKQCIESVLNQKTNARLEIIVGNDGSKDGSLKIVEQLMKDFPDKITLLSSEKNEGMVQNLIQLTKAASGDYISILDGDDYYSDDQKFQKQLDRFEQEPELNAACHNVTLIDEQNLPISVLNKISSEYVTLADSKNGRLIHTNAWLVKRSILHNFEEYAKLLPCNDVLLELKILENGRAGYINETLCVWRQHDKGMSRSISLRDQFKNFELLYKTLYSEKLFKKHYAMCLENFYKQWVIEILKRESKNVFGILLKSFYWQLRNLHLDIRFLYAFMRLLIQKPAYKNRHTEHK